jgi:hypothetical protein
MQYILTINCDGAAFEEDPVQEISNILAIHARYLASGWYSVTETDLRGNVQDVNGNTVGQWTYGRTPAKSGKHKPRMTAEQFFDVFQIARHAVCEAHGVHWVIRGHARLATMPAAWRKFKGPRGGIVKMPMDIHVPPAKFWPSGEIPEGLIFAEPPPATRTQWVMCDDGIERDPLIALVRSVQQEHWRSLGLDMATYARPGV